MVLILVGAYRALGGGPGAEESEALLISAATMLREALIGLPTAADAVAAPPDLALTARDGRRASAAAQQQLDRLPATDQLDDTEASVRALLVAAAEDAAWAWRLVSAGAVSPGVISAVAVLADHAADCCDEAGVLLARTAAGVEPGDGP